MLYWAVFFLIAVYIHINYSLFLITMLLLSKKSVVSQKISQKGLKKVSVIIATKNDEKVIGKTLEKLKKSPNLEIIIVDANSTDKTRHIARKYTRKIIIEKRPSGKAHALNLALRQATSELIYIIDSDSWVSGNTIRKLAGSLSNGYVAAEGQIRIRHRKGIAYMLCSMETRLANSFQCSLFKTMGSAIVQGRNFIINRKALNAVGGFRKVLTEDINLSYRLYKKRQKIAFVPDAIVYEEAPAKLSHFWKQQKRWHAGALREMMHIDAKHILLVPFIILRSVAIAPISITLLIIAILFANSFLAMAAILGILVCFFSYVKKRRDVLLFPAVYLLFSAIMLAIFISTMICICFGRKVEWYKTPKY